MLRIVVRNGFTHDLADQFLGDLRSCLPILRRQPAPIRGSRSASFSHGIGAAMQTAPETVLH